MKNLLQQTGVVLITALTITACSKKNNPNPDGGTTTVNQLSFSDLKKLSTSASVNIPDNAKINGTVISDVTGKNVEANTVVLEDTKTGTGIIVTFAAAPTAAVGDSVEINISKQTLAQVNGEIVVQVVAASNLKKIGTGHVTAKATTAADIAKNAAAWDGTLVSLSAGSFSGGNGNYTGTLTYNDGNNNINSTVLSGATFAGSAYPAAVDAVTGIVRINGNAVSVNIRNTSDVTANTSITRVITDDFSTFATTQNWPAGFFHSNARFTTTPMGTYTGKGNLAYIKPLKGDEAFLSAGTKYMYLLKGGTSYIQAPVPTNDGLTQIKVQVAATTLTGTFADSSYTAGSGPVDYTINPLDPTKTTNTFTLDLTVNGTVIAVKTFNFTDVGVFHTVTFNLPTTEADWETALIAAGSTSDQAKVYGPQLVSGLSSSTPVSVQLINTFYYIYSSGADIYRQPIVIKSLQLGYSK